MIEQDVFQNQDGGSIPTSPLHLKLCITEKDNNLAKKLVENNHSYVPSFKSVGRRIDWLIYSHGELIGMIGIGSSTYPPCKDILKELNISKDDYRKVFNSFANNWRFCFAKKVSNLGSKTLKVMCLLAKIEWKKKYGDDLKYILTFVGGGKDGSVYKAAGWKMVGKTAGLPPHKSVSMKWHNAKEIKERFVKPSSQYSKLIFLKTL